ncbi:Kinesin-like protein [Actinidia chinensis var. chinensis]|uniref:Kinesin-like protein n=1 Tax=Actinidia chinensis var. chinensis TaxID=1590841 RepID=A0A2R6QHH0_ACTCC|nr:Kinesin-like protein [Actinidia chinensis var. chinensis]
MFDSVLGTLEQGQFYPIKDILRSKSFLISFALNSKKMVSSGGDNAEDKPASDMAHVVGDEGETLISRDDPYRGDSVKYIGTIRKSMRKVLPPLPNLTLLKLLGGKFGTLFLVWNKNVAKKLESRVADFEDEKQHTVKKLRRVKEERDADLKRLEKEVAKLKEREALAKTSIERLHLDLGMQYLQIDAKLAEEDEEEEKGDLDINAVWRTLACSLFSARRLRLSLSSTSLFSLSKFKVLKLGIPIFTGMTDFVPYTREYNILPVGILLIMCSIGDFNLTICLRMTW